MQTIQRTNAENKDFIALVKLLDEDLAIRDGEDHPFYDQFNKIDKIKFAVVIYENQQPVGCGALKRFDLNTVEIKRIYTDPAKRGIGIATKVLNELEKWASELGFAACILETGINQPEAISLYKKMNYSIFPNFGQYAGVETSICFKKQLIN